MKIIKIVILFFCIFSVDMSYNTCSLDAGLYKCESSDGLFYAEIALSKDGYFYYKGRWGLFSYVSSGKWYINDKKILLKSSIQDLDSIRIIVSEDYVPNDSEVDVCIRNDQREELRGITKFNNNDSMVCSFQKCFFDKNSELIFLEVRYFEYSSIRYYIKNKKSNKFDIIFPGVIDGGGRYEVFLDTCEVIEPNMFRLRNNEFRLIER